MVRVPRISARKPEEAVMETGRVLSKVNALAPELKVPPARMIELVGEASPRLFETAISRMPPVMVVGPL